MVRHNKRWLHAALALLALALTACPTPTGDGGGSGGGTPAGGKLSTPTFGDRPDPFLPTGPGSIETGISAVVNVETSDFFDTPSGFFYAELWATFDGSTPSRSNGVWVNSNAGGLGGLAIPHSATVNVIALRDGWEDSEVATQYVDVTIFSPFFDADPTIYSNVAANAVFPGSQVSVVSSTSIPSKIETETYYTTDGTTPSSTNGTLLTGPITIAEPTTVKAVTAVLNFPFSDSAVTENSFNVNPVSTVELSSTLTPSDILASGDTLFVSADTSVLVVDVSTPTAPLLLNSYDTGLSTFIRKLQLVGDTLYALSNDEIGIYDASSLATSLPSLGSVDLTSVSGNSIGFAVDGNYAYIGRGRTVLVADVGTPAMAALVPGGSALALSGVDPVIEDVAYENGVVVVSTDVALEVFDVTDPADPTREDSVILLNPEGFAIRGSEVYVQTFVVGFDRAIQVYDIQDAADVSFVANLQGINGPFRFVGDEAVTERSFGRYSFPNSSTAPTPIEAVSSQEVARANVIVGDYAFVASGTFEAHLEVIELGQTSD